MGMKVCKLVRLTQKDEKGNFANTKEGKITLRKKVVISEESVKETEDNFKSTGLLYIVDETATAARDKMVDAEIEAARNTEAKEQEAPKVDAGATL